MPATRIDRRSTPTRGGESDLRTARDGKRPGRAVDRMLLALRAYEQRAQRRAALHAWLLARNAPTNRTSPRHRPATAR